MVDIEIIAETNSGFKKLRNSIEIEKYLKKYIKEIFLNISEKSIKGNIFEKIFYKQVF